MEEFHLETSSIEESEDEQWVTDNEDNGYFVCVLLMCYVILDHYLLIKI